MTPTIYDVAKSYLGIEEFPGAKHNPKIVKMFADSGNAGIKDDETPWCAAFVGAVLAQCGIKGTGKLNARSYLNWGQVIDLKDAQRGDVIIFERPPNPQAGHVAFFDSFSPRKGWLRVLGGNQGNAVSVKEFPMLQVIGVRRAKALQPSKPDRSSAVQSTTIRAVVLQLLTGAGGGATAVGALDGRAQIVALLLCGAVVLTALWIMRERLKKWADGVR